MSELEIRRARPDDLEAIVEIHNQAIRSRATGHGAAVTVPGRRDWLASRREDRPVLVAASRAGVLGWAELGEYRPGRRAFAHTAEVSYHVHEQHRRQGIGEALLRRCIDLSPALGVRVLLAIVLESNRPSIRLLRKAGFARWGRLPGVAAFPEGEVDHLYYGRRVP